MKKNVVIAGGGTGGHIYPGFALAEKLQKQDPNIEVHFVGAVGGLEEKIVPANGYPIHLLRVGRLHQSVSLFRRLKTLVLLPLSFFQSIYLFLKIKPQWVLGIGGFASGPFVFVASILGARTAILEPNAYPGMANRWLAKVVETCFVVFSETGKYFPNRKTKEVGLPVRLAKKSPSMSFDQSRAFRILVFGGSQGARAINNIVGEWVEQLGDQGPSFEILHQIGSRDFQTWQARYANQYDSFLTYTEYIHDMPEKLDWADLVICRAGIGSVVEVAMAGKPALFIPLPTAADNHQVKNAQVLAAHEAALMIEQKNLDPQILGQTIEELRLKPEKLKNIMDNLKSFDYSGAPEQILAHLMRD